MDKEAAEPFGNAVIYFVLSVSCILLMMHLIPPPDTLAGGAALLLMFVGGWFASSCFRVARGNSIRESD